MLDVWSSRGPRVRLMILLMALVKIPLFGRCRPCLRIRNVELSLHST